MKRRDGEDPPPAVLLLEAQSGLQPPVQGAAAAVGRGAAAEGAEEGPAGPRHHRPQLHPPPGRAGGPGARAGRDRGHRGAELD